MRKAFDLEAHFAALSLKDGLPADFLRYEATVEFLTAWLAQLRKTMSGRAEGSLPRLAFRDRSEWLRRYHAMEVDDGALERAFQRGSEPAVPSRPGDHVGLAILASKLGRDVREFLSTTPDPAVRGGPLLCREERPATDPAALPGKGRASQGAA